MTTTIKHDVLQVVAAEDLQAADKKYKVLSIGGTITSAARSAAGLLVTSVQSGGHASAAYAGVSKVWASAAVTSVGWPFTATTSGWTAAVASGGYAIGRYLDTCNSGDLVEAFIDFRSLAYQGAP